MEERTIANCNELFSVIDKYGDRGFYFRGESKDNKNTACLPVYLRGLRENCGLPALDNEMLKQKLEELGVGFPYTPPTDDSPESSINHVLASDYDWSFRKWGEEKLEALMSHYSPDFKALDEAVKNAEHKNASFPFRQNIWILPLI